MLISGHKDARIFARYNVADARDEQDATHKVFAYDARKRQDRRLRLEVEKRAQKSPNHVLGSHGFTAA
ncbi:hypothetical protein SBA2_120041 [Acidobacteriia bacterium SbA2]|nr:hypothetical protein SBA2_120041 [Acidobacteriia bacterium SbA2]